MKNINEIWMKQRSFRRLVRTNMKNANDGNITPINNETVSIARSNRFARMGRPINTTSVSEGISICLTAWKTADYIEECLDSIENQTWFKTHDNFEVLLGIDACEETLAKVKEIMHKYRNLSVYMMDKNVGTYVTTNTMMSLAQYEWLLRFDTDDIMPNDMIEKIFTKRISSYDIITYRYSNFGIKNGGGKAYGSHMIRNNIWKKYGGYRDWRISADYDLLHRLSNDVKIVFFENIFYKRRTHKDSLIFSEETSLKSDLRKKLNYFVENESHKEKVITCITYSYDVILKKTERIPVVVNMTTWTKRDWCLPIMLTNFKKQTLVPDKIILWLSEEEYNKEKLPKHILKCLSEGLLTDIMWVKKNTYCHKRHECFKYFNDCFNVIVDDDILYPNNYLSEIVNSAKKHMNTITCYCANSIEYNGVKPIIKHGVVGESIYNNFMGGCCCFPPNTYPLESFEYETLRDKYVPKCDESWMRAFFIKKHMKINIVKDRSKVRFNIINNTQSDAVWNENKKVLKNGIREKERNFFNAIKIVGVEKESKKIWPNIGIDEWKLTL